MSSFSYNRILVIFFTTFCTFLLNQAVAQFDGFKQIDSKFRSPSEVVTIDLDIDGDNDIIVADRGGNRIVWFENLGQSVFSEVKILVNLNSPIAILANDIDNDGDLDIISSSLNDSKIVKFENLGGTNYGTEVVLNNSINDVRSICAFDIDGDGDDDIVAASYGDDKIIWHENNVGIFGSEQLISNSSLQASHVVNSDIDNDGDDDVLFASQGNNSINLCENLGTGSFGSQQVLTSTASNPIKILSGDIDGDLDNDIIYCFQDSLAWQENLGLGSFGPQQLIDSYQYINGGTLTDLNNDGDLDIVVFSDASYFFWPNGVIRLYDNNGLGVFNDSEISEFHSFIKAISIEDVNGDGWKDITAISSIDDDVFWFENQTNGSFSSLRSIFTTSNYHDDILSVDLNGDGQLDILASGYYDNEVFWMQNIGNHEYSEERTIANKMFTTNNLSRVALDYADFDNDGDIDVLSSFWVDSALSWYPNDGQGMFGQEQLISNTDLSHNVVTADIDNDGDFDVISTYIASDKIVWFENLGGGIFSSEHTILNNTDAHDLRVVDFDNDGYIDLLFNSFVTNRVYWVKNINGTSFSTDYLIGGINSPRFDIGDIDNDGDQDVVVMNSGWINSLTWYENIGGGNVSYHSIGNPNNMFYSVHCSDVNGDGIVDILTGATSNDFMFFENLGAGNFAPHQSVPVQNPIEYVQSGDFDSDGDMDFLGRTGTSGSLSRSVISVESQFLNSKQVRGKFFIDLNQNGINDSTELGLNQIQILSSPLSDFSFSDSEGNYFMNFSDVNGSYSLYPSNLQYWSITTDSLSYTVLVDSNDFLIDSLDFGFFPDTLVHEANGEIIGAFPRCNTLVNYWVNIQNTGSTIANGKIHLHLDDSVSLVSSNFTPDSIIGQNIYWHFDSLFYFSDSLYNFNVQMPDFNSIGFSMSSTIALSLFDSTGTQVFNSNDTLTQTLLCAYDPNDKISDPPGLDSLGYVHPTTSSFDYTIRFQNTGNDTAIAVVLYDQLDSNLDWSSIDILGSSHEVDIQIDQNGLATFTFDSIFLPDSSTNEIESHGFIKYHIDLNSNVPVGTQIKNTAEIYFDYNPPIITNTVINTLYNCSNLSLIMSSLSVCENELISVSADLSDMVIDWNIIGVENGVGNELLWIADTAGIFDLQVYASHPFCNIDTLTTITVYPEVLPTILDSTTICSGDSTLIFGQFQSQSGTYIEVLQSSNGCDSLIMKSLNVLSPIPLNIIDTLTICEGDSIELFGLFENQSGLYTETIFAANGCDSSNAYFLEVQPFPQVNFGVLGADSLCVYYSSIILNSGTPVGGIYSGSGVNTSIFDPSLAGVGLHTISYTYTSPFGCTDSDSTNIFVAECLGLTNLDLTSVSVYPNPFKEELKIDFGSVSKESIRIELINALGQIVYKNDKVESSPFILKRNKLVRGTYFVNLYAEGSLFFSDLIIVM